MSDFWDLCVVAFVAVMGAVAVVFFWLLAVLLSVSPILIVVLGIAYGWKWIFG